MSDCGVCLTSDCDYDSDGFCVVRERKAAKPHKCCECRKEIARGERYEYASGKFDGGFWQEATCLVCAEIADTFYCEGRTSGGILWDQMCDTAFPVMTTGCLDRLTTAAAKAELLRRWNVWKFGRP